jgi:hypothetical protein
MQSSEKQERMSDSAKGKPAYEYTLHSIPKLTLESRRFNVMHIAGASSFSWENFTQPIHMYKETPEVRRAKWQLASREKKMMEGVQMATPMFQVPKATEASIKEISEVSGSAGVVAPFGIQHQRKNLFRKKTIILAKGSAPRPPKNPEAGFDRWPMVLEDDDGNNSYLGRVEGNSRSSYVLFIREVIGRGICSVGSYGWIV